MVLKEEPQFHNLRRIKLHFHIIKGINSSVQAPSELAAKAQCYSYNHLHNLLLNASIVTGLNEGIYQGRTDAKDTLIPITGVIYCQSPRWRGYPPLSRTS